MEFFETVKVRRSVRRFTDKPVPAEVLQKAFDAALIAPNSSNTQTWDFYWVRQQETKKKLVEYCFSQSAARKAQELVVVVADPKLWKRSNAPLIQYAEQIKAPDSVKQYYKNLVPLMYRWGVLNSIGVLKWALTSIAGLFRPVPRGPYGKSGVQLVAVKSAALAVENFVLAISAQGFSSCLMEGFDESRVARLLKLPGSARVVVVIGVGEAAADGIMGPQFRIPREQVIHII